MTIITGLHISNFRNYQTVELSALPNGFIVLTGHNGAGKTNILEALSLFGQNRGLRKAGLEDMQSKQYPRPGWQIGMHTDSDLYGPIPMAIRFNPDTGRKILRLKKEDIKAQTAFLDYIQLLWLTPQMDSLFLDASTERRRFFDRMIYNGFDGAHAGRLTRYENALRQRSKLLTDEENLDPDPIWLDSLENDMAETGVAIAAARIDFIQRLNQANQLSAKHQSIKSFPLGHFAISGYLEDMLLKGAKAVAAEEAFRKTLSQSRRNDAQRGGAKEGVHKSDFQVTHQEKNMPADQCSTGEQKALLTGIILSYAQMLKAESQQMPILLLDEIAAHFDQEKREELFALLESFGSQIWMTGTEPEVFDRLQGKAYFMDINNNAIEKRAA